MICFRSGIPQLRACIAAVLLCLLFAPGFRASDEPRAFHVEGDVVGAHDPSIINLSNADIHAHNTFEQREVVVPQTKPLSISGGTLVVEFPPASVVAMNIQLN